MSSTRAATSPLSERRWSCAAGSLANSRTAKAACAEGVRRGSGGGQKRILGGRQLSTRMHSESSLHRGGPVAD
eukprot:1192894-Prorocentrum_minimum.AAC.2